MAASGCSGDSDAEAESPLATTTVQVETQPPAQPTVGIAKFRAAFKETFGTPPNERPWYGLITGMKMAGVWLDITTKLAPGSAHDNESAICGAAAKLAIDLGVLGNGIRGVRVIGSDGVELGGCA
jgi:hypothetical protein